MKLLSKNRAAAFGAAGALAVGTAITGVGAANAATTSYNCDIPMVGVVPVPVTAKSPFPNEVRPGEAVPSEVQNMGVTLAPGLVGIIVNVLKVTSVAGTIADTALSVGDTSVPLTGITAATTALPTDGVTPATLPVTGTTGAFTAPTTLGSYPVKLPSSFTFTPTASDGGTPLVGSFPCTLPDGSSSQIGTMKVVDKYSSKTAARLKNAPITTSKHAKIAVKVVNGNGAAAAGKVIAKKGTKTIAKGTLSDAGRKTLVLPLLKRGDQKIVVKYLGSSTTQASKKVLTFTVRRG